MSYILDALKKSEQERGHGNIPDVQTVHSSSLNYRSEKKTYWPYILIVAVVLNLLAIIYFIVEKKSPEQIADTTQQTNVATPAITENNATTKIETSKKPAIIISNNKTTSVKEAETEKINSKTEKTQPAKPVESITRQAEKPAIVDNEKILDFYDLPESIKQSMPSFVISAHIYSTNPEQRSIVINNNFLEEGEYVLDDLILQEITPDGAIFNYQGTVFSYGVVSGWQ